MKDVSGKVLEVGDKIAFIPQKRYKNELSLGVITGFTKHKVRIDVTAKAVPTSEDTCLKFPKQIAKTLV